MMEFNELPSEINSEMLTSSRTIEKVYIMQAIRGLSWRLRLAVTG